MVEGTKGWIVPLLAKIFEREEAQQIYSIPINRMGYKDMLIWNYSKNGRFSIKSATIYHKLEKKRIRGAYLET